MSCRMSARMSGRTTSPPRWSSSRPSAASPTARRGQRPRQPRPQTRASDGRPAGTHTPSSLEGGFRGRGGRRPSPVNKGGLHKTMKSSIPRKSPRKKQAGRTPGLPSRRLGYVFFSFQNLSILFGSRFIRLFFHSSSHRVCGRYIRRFSLFHVCNCLRFASSAKAIPGPVAPGRGLGGWGWVVAPLGRDLWTSGAFGGGCVDLRGVTC